MSIRGPDPEIIESLVRQEANDINGLLNLPEDRQQIQEKYHERHQEKYGRVSTGRIKYTPEASRDDIRLILQNLAADDQRDIQHVENEVYYNSPFTNLDLSSENEVIERLTSIYNTYVVFTGERVRKELDVPKDHDGFFLSRLEKQGLIERLSHAQSVFTIGREFKQIADEPSVQEKLMSRATEGILKNHKFEQIIDAPATEEVVSLFVEKDYLIDMNGEYLVKKALDEYIESVKREVTPKVRNKFEKSDHVMQRAEYRSLVTKHIREQSELLSHAPDMKNDIVQEVREGVTEELNLEEVSYDDIPIIIDQEKFKPKVESKVNSITENVRSEGYALANQMFDAAEEKVNKAGIEGGDVVNKYYRQRVRDQCIDRLEEEEFST